MGDELRPRRDGLAAALACVADARADQLRRVLTTCRAVAAAVGPVRVTPAGVHLPPVVLGWDDLLLTITNAREAWEVLATRGVIPDAWVDEPRRAFACTVCKGKGSCTYVDTETGEREWDPCHACDRICVACDGKGEDARATGGYCARCAGTGYEGTGARSHPTTVAACVALAADVPGVLAAEALARELTGRDRVVWRVAAQREVRAPPYNHSRADGPYAPCPTCALLERQRLAARGVVKVDVPRSLLLRDLLATGYALDAVDDTAVTLTCLALEAAGE